MNTHWQYEIDFPWITPAQETSEALQILETPNIYELHPHHQQRIIDLANKVARHNLQRGQLITNPSDSSTLIQSLLQERAEECMTILFMDTKHQVIAFEELFHWSVNQAAVYTRVLVKRTLEHNASAIILAHNHPSWTTEPSQADIQLTKRIKEAMDLIEVKLLDHFVVSTEGIASFAERGLV